MSSRFDMVINCDLREDTPEEFIDAIRCLTQRDYQLSVKPQFLYPHHGNVWDSFYDHHFLAPDPQQGIISSFVRLHRLTIPLENHREVYRYRLQYCGSMLHGDYWAHHHIPFVYWLATIAYDVHIGYYVEASGSRIHLLKVANGRLLEPYEV
jgi:hypothetical protein